MGLLGRIAARFGGLDPAAELVPMLPRGDRLLAHCQVVPARESEGAEGIAASLPQSGAPKILAVTVAGLSLWDFGRPGHVRLPPTLDRGIARSEAVSFVRIGRSAQGGVPLARITFRDTSYFDYLLTGRPGPRFWAAMADFGA